MFKNEDDYSLDILTSDMPLDQSFVSPEILERRNQSLDQQSVGDELRIYIDSLFSEGSFRQKLIKYMQVGHWISVTYFPEQQENADECFANIKEDIKNTSKIRCFLRILKLLIELYCELIKRKILSFWYLDKNMFYVFNIFYILLICILVYVYESVRKI